MTDLHEGLKALGEGKTRYQYSEPDAGLLERFRNPHSRSAFEEDHELASGDSDLTLEIETDEFTSLCPKTGQPDYATIVIQYQPNAWCVESKSLKLYLMGFRQHGEFHESCVTRIGQDLVRLLNPDWLRVIGQFTPRGGIQFWPTYQYVAEGVSLK